MLRSVCFKNFVQFKDYQVLDFRNDGPSIFIGENGSGKSSVLEGIRRCLKLELSTSVSSPHDSSQLSYFLCNFETYSSEKENVICGIVSRPGNQTSEESQHEIKRPHIEEEMEIGEVQTSYERRTSVSQRMSVDEVSEDDIPATQSKRKRKSGIGQENSESTSKRNMPGQITGDTSGVVLPGDASQTSEKCSEVSSVFYKFALTYTKTPTKDNNQMYVNLVEVSKTPDCETKMNVKEKYSIKLRSEILDSILGLGETKPDEKDIDLFVRSVFENIHEDVLEVTDDLAALLESLSKEVVFTFPLRSIGPLQWSESKRIVPEERKTNYEEADSRCEIIKCFLRDKNDKFDKEQEREYFKQITQFDDYDFELIDDKISLPKGKYALLKTPEGILEAKAFSILMSSNYYRTLFLEEPDRGMHPQFIERMMQIIKQKKNEKRIILTTHNTSFISAWSVPNCFVFRRHDAECRIISGRSLIAEEGKEDNMKQIRLLTSDHISDILFAKKVLFFEGDSELLFFTEVRNQILAGESRIAENLFGGDEGAYNRLKKSLIELTFIKMNGKDKTDFCQKISAKLKLEHIVLVDRDAVTRIRQKDESKEVRKREEDAKNTRTLEEWREIRKTLSSTSNVFFWLNGSIEDMVKEISENKKALEHLNVGRKLFLDNSIKSSDITKNVKLILDHCKPEHDLAEFIKLLEEV